MKGSVRISKLILLFSIIIVLSLFIKVSTVKGGSETIRLETSNINVTFDRTTGIVIFDGISTEESKLTVDDYNNIKELVGEAYIKSIEFNNLRFDSVMPKLNVTRCTEITFNNISTSHTVYMEGVFENCKALIELDLSEFDTSNIDSIAAMFNGCESLQSIQGLENWDLRKNRTLWFLFSGCSSLTDLSAISNWNTDNVESLDSTFKDCEKLETIGELSNWSLPKNKNLAHTFYNCKLLTEISGINNWDVSNVETLWETFGNCESLITIDVSSWLPSNSEYFYATFRGCANLENLDLTNWDISNATNISSMFNQCRKLTTAGDLGNWDVSNVTNFEATFSNSALQYIGDISRWDVSSATTLNQAFSSTSLENLGNLGGWDVSNVTDFYAVFSSSDNLNYIGDLSNWDMSKAETIQYLFAATALSNVGDLSNWKVGNCKNFNGLFSSTGNLTAIGDLSSWDVSKGQNFQYMFNACGKLTSIGNLDNWDVSNSTTFNMMFSGCGKLEGIGELANWKVGKCTDFAGMFANCGMLTSLDLSKWDVGKATTIADMFKYCSKLTTIGDVSNWNTENCTVSRNMFFYCKSLEELNLTNWNFSNNTNINSMFHNCNNLTSVGDISNWDVSKVQYFNQLFLQCHKLNNIGDLGNWDVSQAYYINEIFSGCESLESVGDLSNWKFNKAYYTNNMFTDCKSLTELNLANWEFQATDNLDNIFRNCTSLKTLNISGWDISKIVRDNSIFDGCNALDDIKTPKIMSDIDIQLPAQFYSLEDENLYTTLNKSPLSCWIYRNKEHSIEYTELDEEYIIKYNLPTSFWEADSISIKFIGKVLDDNSNPNHAILWSNVVNSNNENVSIDVNSLGQITINRGARDNLKVIHNKYEYKLLTLKNIIDESYIKQIYYIPTLSFVNIAQTESLPTFNDTEGCKYLGWSTSNTELREIDNSSKFDADIIYAYWEIKTFNIVIRDTYGDTNYTCKYGDTIWNIIERYLTLERIPEGKFIASWNTKEDGSGQVINSSYKCTEDIIIYPIYFSDFSVKIPQSLIADKDGNCSFNVSSNIELGEIELTFPNIIYYHQNNKDDIPANLNYDDNKLTKYNNKLSVSIQCQGLTAGSWKCIFYIHIKYNENK